MNLDFIKKTIFKNNKIYITSPFGYRTINSKKEMHWGVDIGTNLKKLPIYASYDGEVLEAKKEKTTDTLGLGNRVYIKYKDYILQYAHLDSFKVKTGQSIKQGELIGYVGSSGNSSGIHLHLGACTIKGWEQTQYTKKGWFDPLTIKYVEEIKIYGQPVNRNEYIDQISILIDNLRVRDKANGNVLGYIKKGLYNVLNSKIDGNYTWYEVESGYWIAYSDEWAVFYTTKEIEQPNEEAPEIPIYSPVEEQTPELEECIETEQNPNTEAKETPKLTIFQLIIKLIQEIYKFLKKGVK